MNRIDWIRAAFAKYDLLPTCEFCGEKVKTDRLPAKTTVPCCSSGTCYDDYRRARRNLRRELSNPNCHLWRA